MKILLHLSLLILFCSLSLDHSTQAGTANSRQNVTTQDQKPESTASQLIDKGKIYYRSAKFQLALEKFEEALKHEPENDEALGLAAVTSFRLDNQTLSREYFRRRAELGNQKGSVKAFCYYRVALTYWREVHDIVGRYGAISNDRLIYRLPEDEAAKINNGIQEGLVYVERALAITSDFAEAYNVRNLLHAEAGMAGASDDSGEEHRQQSFEALRRAIDLAEVQDNSRRGDVADFSQPTFRIGEFAETEEQEGKLQDPLFSRLDGGRPIKRVKANFTRMRPARRNANDAADATGKSAPQPINPNEAQIVKIEVLISTTGDVVFAHVIDGHPTLTGSALLAARGWKFEPARFEGRPVQVSGIISFEMKSKTTR